MYTTALILAAIGGLNWGLIGLFDYNLVSAIFGVDTFFSNLIYILVGLSAAYILVAHFAHMGNRSKRHERDHHRESRPASAYR